MTTASPPGTSRAQRRPAQREVTERTLAAIGAGSTQKLWLLNKCDHTNDAPRAQLEASFPEALLVSSFHPSDVAKVRTAIASFFSSEI